MSVDENINYYIQIAEMFTDDLCKILKEIYPEFHEANRYIISHRFLMAVCCREEFVKQLKDEDEKDESRLQS
jgi:hypothetical protein